MAERYGYAEEKGAGMEVHAVEDGVLCQCGCSDRGESWRRKRQLLDDAR